MSQTKNPVNPDMTYPLAAAMMFTPIILGTLVRASASRPVLEGQPAGAGSAFSLEVAVLVSVVFAILSFVLGDWIFKGGLKGPATFAPAKQLSLIVRLALSETIAIIGFVWAHSEKNFLVYCYFGAAAIALMLMHTTIMASKRPT